MAHSSQYSMKCSIHNICRLFIAQLLAGSRPQLKQSVPTSSRATVVPSSPHPTTPNYSTSLATRKRGRTFDFETDSAKRRRGAQSYSSRQSGEKQHNKGLRHFSQRVCEKVREKGATTYNEVRIREDSVLHMHVGQEWVCVNEI